MTFTRCTMARTVWHEGPRARHRQVKSSVQLRFIHVLNTINLRSFFKEQRELFCSILYKNLSCFVKYKKHDAVYSSMLFIDIAEYCYLRRKFCRQQFYLVGVMHSHTILKCDMASSGFCATSSTSFRRDLDIISCIRFQRADSCAKFRCILYIGNITST